MRALVCVAMLALAPTAWAGEDEAADRFARLSDDLVPVCVGAAATRCFETAFGHADTDGDDRLTGGELDALRRDAMAWFFARRDELTASEQTMIALVLAAVNTAGVERLVAAYDTDGDGRLDRGEVTADVTLDERPLPALVRDEEAVDWAAIRARLGAVAGTLLPAPN